MARVVFTPNLARHVSAATVEAPGKTVREVLDAVFAANEQARGYVLDDQAALRRHMTVFIGATRVRDRILLSDPVPEGSTLYVLQALSGG
jgi:hypothetical protein